MQVKLFVRSINRLTKASESTRFMSNIRHIRCSTAVFAETERKNDEGALFHCCGMLCVDQSCLGRSTDQKASTSPAPGHVMAPMLMACLPTRASIGVPISPAFQYQESISAISEALFFIQKVSSAEGQRKLHGSLEAAYRRLHLYDDCATHRPLG
jgi:hypothetical protein